MLIRVVTIGAGNVAHSLIEGVVSCEGLSLEGVMVRSEHSLELIRERFAVRVATSLEELPSADLYIMAVSDGAVEQLSRTIKPPHGAVVAHTAGSLPLDAISESCENRAGIYPMQTFTKGYSVDWGEIPIFVEGSTLYALNLVEEVAQLLSEKVYRLTSQQRERLHLAAVFGCNFANLLWELSSRELAKINLPFSTLAPLVEQTLRKAVESQNPSSVQTGPAARGDILTQESHLRLIGDSEQEEIYKLISSMIWRISKRN